MAINGNSTAPTPASDDVIHTPIGRIATTALTTRRPNQNFQYGAHFWIFHNHAHTLCPSGNPIQLSCAQIACRPFSWTIEARLLILSVLSQQAIPSYEAAVVTKPGVLLR